MRIRGILLVPLMTSMSVAWCDPLQHDLLLFSSAELAGVFERTAPVTNVKDEVLNADVLFSLQQGSLRLFCEYLITDHESDLERLQLGWQLSENTIVWMGRYQQPASVWNHDHHHGQYLQTSITRPAIDEWEDLGGVLPQHFSGVLIESSWSAFAKRSLKTAVGAGISPVLTPEGMESFDLVHPKPPHGELGFQARAALYRDEFDETGIGVLLAYDDLNALGWPVNARIQFDRVDLTLYGAFGTYATADWRIEGTMYYTLANIHAATPGIDHHFIVGHVQAERHLPHGFTPFVRLEDSSEAGRSRYLSLFGEFAKARYIAGLRWDFLQHQALTFQASSTDALRGQFKDVRLQWSAAFF